MISLAYSDIAKGNFLLFAGIVLLLHTLGLAMKVMYILMLVSSLLMIFWGFVRAGYYNKIIELIQKKDPQ